MAKRRGTSRKGSRKDRKSRKATRKATRKANRKSLRGGFEAAPVGQIGKELNSINLAQGQQFAKINAPFHGGALYGGPYPGAVTSSQLPADLQASAHLSPLNKAFEDIRGLKDQVGGKRKGSRKNRKSTRKNRKGSRKDRKDRKNRRSWTRKGRKGGALGYMPMNEFNKMLLPAGLEGKAGLNPEWKLAEDPNAFAPY